MSRSRCMTMMRMAAVTLGLFALRATADTPRNLLREGTSAYRAEAYTNAAAAFLEAFEAASETELDPAVPLFNLGNSLLRQGLPQQAAERYNEALRTENLELQGEAYFNRGNAMMRIAEHAQEGGALEPAAGAAETAVDMYEKAVTLRPDDTDAKMNYELALRKYEELKELLEQQQQQDQQQPQEEQRDQPQQDQQQEQQQDQQEQGAQDTPQQQPSESDQPTEQEQPAPSEEMTPEEALMMLEAMKEEEAAEREQMRLQLGEPVPVTKDW